MSIILCILSNLGCRRIIFQLLETFGNSMKGRIPELRNRFSYLPKLQGLKHRNASSGLLITSSYFHVGRGQFFKILFFSQLFL